MVEARRDIGAFAAGAGECMVKQAPYLIAGGLGDESIFTCAGVALLSITDREAGSRVDRAMAESEEDSEGGGKVVAADARCCEGEFDEWGREGSRRVLREWKHAALLEAGGILFFESSHEDGSGVTLGRAGDRGVVADCSHIRSTGYVEPAIANWEYCEDACQVGG